MLRQCTTHIVPKQISECTILRNKLHVNIARPYYNNNNVTTTLVQDLRKRQSLLDVKREHEEKNPVERLVRKNNLLFSSTDAPEVYNFFTFNLKEWWQHKKREYRKFVQRENYKNYVNLGPDLATAQFVLRSGGRVKFKGTDEWLEWTKTKGKNMPALATSYDPRFTLEAVDLKGHPIEFDNLTNLLNLYHIKWLSLRGCKTIDDWALDKLSSEFPTLEYFDISECINVTEKGLEALYRMPNLKKLIITNYNNSVALELTCFLLEDVNPFLQCEIRKPEKKLLPNE